MFGFESNAPSRTKFFVDREKGGWREGRAWKFIEIVSRGIEV